MVGAESRRPLRDLGPQCGTHLAAARQLAFFRSRAGLALPDLVRLVEQGTADLALGIFEALPGSLYRRGLYTDSLVCVVRSNHPSIAGGLSLEHYLALRHVTVTISGVGESAVDAALSALGLTRHVALRVPHFLAGAMLAAESDMVLTLPSRLARRLAEKLPLVLTDLPLQVAPLSPAMIWHERFHGDPAHAWVRQQLVDVVASFNTAGYIPQTLSHV